MKKIPIGYSDFKRIISTPDFLYVDKTGLIEEFLEDPVQILLITRPRRFGKTLNLSTLRYFFDQENAVENRKLFDGLKVSQNEQAMAEQGKRPVIYLTFKDCKELKWADMLVKTRDLLSDVCRGLADLKNPKINPVEWDKVIAIREQKLNDSLLSNALRILSQAYTEHYGVSPLILIDEYDVPLQSAWTFGYWDEAITFFRNFFSSGFKDNPLLVAWSHYWLPASRQRKYVHRYEQSGSCIHCLKKLCPAFWFHYA